MLLIVFGAGASWDSSPDIPVGTSDDLRIPLSDGLFDIVHASQASMWPDMSPLLPYLRHRGEGVSVEQVMDTLARESLSDVERLRQLMAVRFYVHLVIWERERHWLPACQGVSNYRTLVDEARRIVPSDATISIVTFNYDTMVERALERVGRKFDALTSYVGDPAGTCTRCTGLAIGHAWSTWTSPRLTS